MPSIALSADEAKHPERDYIDRWVILREQPGVQTRYWTGADWSHHVNDARQYRLPGYAKQGETMMRRRHDVLQEWTIRIGRIYNVPRKPMPLAA